MLSQSIVKQIQTASASDLSELAKLATVGLVEAKIRQDLALYKDYLHSGQTQAQYCKSHNLHIHTIKNIRQAYKLPSKLCINRNDKQTKSLCNDYNCEFCTYIAKVQATRRA